MGIRSDLQTRLRALLNSEIIKGKVAVQRAYADWRRYPQYIVPLSEASIDLIFAPAFGSNKKNATDIRLAIDALELVFTRPEIGTFILLSGDSDFSSLVLKLKEYGKYIIGVGMRESASELLVQNCDEYYGYNELTGLTREGDAEYLRRDPWELVVEAVLQMKKAKDVMRSDRLKQVMQSIDPNFDEKDAGFSRFSKFVLEAGQRGLVKVAKLDNGQFEVDIGKNANLPPEEEAALRDNTAAPKVRGTRTRRRRTSRQETETGGALTLAEAFELLRQALLVLEAIGEGETDSAAVRNQMIELFGDEADPVFDRSRFLRLLRQAHDADLIELVKGDDGVYRLKLQPQSLVGDEGGEADAGEPEKGASDGGDETGAPAATARAQPAAQRSERARTRTSRTPRGRSKRATPKKKDAPASAQSEAGRTSPEAEAEREGSLESGTAARKKNPRRRRRSRGAVTRQPEQEAGEEPASEQRPASQTRAVRQTTSGLGPRRGSRRGAVKPPAAPPPPPPPPGPLAACGVVAVADDGGAARDTPGRAAAATAVRRRTVAARVRSFSARRTRDRGR